MQRRPGGEEGDKKKVFVSNAVSNDKWESQPELGCGEESLAGGGALQRLTLGHTLQLEHVRSQLLEAEPKPAESPWVSPQPRCEAFTFPDQLLLTTEHALPITLP